MVNQLVGLHAVTSGVPQGSLLGPLPLSLIANNLPSVVRSVLVLLILLMMQKFIIQFNLMRTISCYSRILKLYICK